MSTEPRVSDEQVAFYIERMGYLSNEHALASDLAAARRELAEARAQRDAAIDALRRLYACVTDGTLVLGTLADEREFTRILADALRALAATSETSAAPGEK